MNTDKTCYHFRDHEITSVPKRLPPVRTEEGKETFSRGGTAGKERVTS